MPPPYMQLCPASSNYYVNDMDVTLDMDHVLLETQICGYKAYMRLESMAISLSLYCRQWHMGTGRIRGESQ